MGSASGSGSGNPASGKSLDTTSAPSAPAVSAGSGRTDSSGQPSGQGRQPTPPSPSALWWALGLVVMLLGLDGLGVVLYRTWRTATHRY